MERITEKPRKLCDMMVHRHDICTAREDVEWSNTWHSNADRECDKRYLLVGDSTSRMMRGPLEEATGVPTDILASSFGLHDKMLINLYDAFFKDNDFKYDVIFVQLGSHTRFGETGKPYSEEDYKILKDDFGCIIDFLSQFARKVVVEPSWLIVKNKNHLLKKLNIYRYASFLGLYKEPYDVEATEITKGKNRVFKEVAEEKNIDFLDINAIMDKTRYIRRDHIHYEYIARPFIVKQMMKYL